MAKIINYKSIEQNKSEKFDKVTQDSEKADVDLNSALLQADIKLNNGSSLNESDIDKILENMKSLSHAQTKMDKLAGVEPSKIIIE